MHIAGQHPVVEIFKHLTVGRVRGTRTSNIHNPPYSVRVCSGDN
jgi:hypothetical protein